MAAGNEEIYHVIRKKEAPMEPLFCTADFGNVFAGSRGNDRNQPFVDPLQSVYRDALGDTGTDHSFFPGRLAVHDADFDSVKRGNMVPVL